MFRMTFSRIGQTMAQLKQGNDGVRVKLTYLNLGFWSVAEIVVGLLILSACKPGFEVLVICSIALIYVQIMWMLVADSYSHTKIAASFAVELTTIRKNIEEIKHPEREHPVYPSDNDPELLFLQKATQTAQVATWIAQVKYFVIGLICIVVVLKSVL